MEANVAGAAPGDSVDCRMWGKAQGLPRVYPVVCHMLDSAAVFAALWDGVLGPGMRSRIAAALGLGEADARAVAAFWAGLHDLGKISPPFQVKVPEEFAKLQQEAAYAFARGAEREVEFRHEVATHWALAGLLAEAGYPAGTGNMLLRAVSHQIAQLLGGHHGVVGSALSRHKVAQASGYQPGLGGKGWADQRRAHFQELRRVTGGTAVPDGLLPAELAVVILGLVVLADWLASSTQHILTLLPAHGWRGAPEELDAHWKLTNAAAADLVRNARIGRVTFDAQAFGEMFPFPPNPLQQDIADHLPHLVAGRSGGLVLVTAPTGDGKTEAALHATSVLGRASGARGLYFALPTMATADGMFPRVRQFAGKALGGERALALVHSMAWLSPLYAAPDGPVVGAFATGPEDPDLSAQDAALAISADDPTTLEANAWLRSPRRALLAPLGVGTIDQALAGVLPLRHNALRLFGLSDKVFVVDEAHAYGPWMHQLLTTLLEWLGAFRAPVVLLSATLTGRTATSLVDAYRRGAGFTEPTQLTPCYPGWLYVDAETGATCTPRHNPSNRERVLDVELHRVRWDALADPSAPPRSGGRRGELRALLRPVAEDGGTALVCCTTVAEAQNTYRDLLAAFPDLAATEGGIRLLHSRYPAYLRQRISAACEVAYGKPDPDAEPPTHPRPASILVATQVVEQSLDLDFDLIISDLAPLAQLLQRAGRARRHARGPAGRPAWASNEARPQLVVLEPVNDEDRTTPSPTWGAVYHHSLLIRTAHLLRSRTGGIHVPGDVQEIVDAVYAEEFVDHLDDSAQAELRAKDAEFRAQEHAASHMAEVATIPRPADIDGNLHALSRREAGITEELLTTRLGADTGRLLCLYEQPDGTLTLDPDGTTPLPKGTSREELTQIVSHVAPVPGDWLRGDSEQGLVPTTWRKHTLLRDLVPLRMRPEGAGAWAGRHSTKTIVASEEVGLEAP
ncbi:CRISPR-associated endonuclease Cas3'' [Actinacidiphila epipremni]|uniref:CRISPR-associated endonuclease Cas3 n=1 Tax=Actinacidiphila epipremni TaxID=2053013 RepID=A0ABX0ZXP9_9ACTN|nr:CRISPR-associated endonuclease Cas3'' [Actinacidiphila epipremni]NJP46499.1 CRISPR-associated endonuclease Cas3'' [Actinacidiphila epipremni]